jgi:hypothetical protein
MREKKEAQNCRLFSFGCRVIKEIAGAKGGGVDIENIEQWMAHQPSVSISKFCVMKISFTFKARQLFFKNCFVILTNN